MLKKFNLGLVALLLGFGLVFTQSAFTTRFSTFWAYQPDGDNDPTDYQKYEHTSTPSELCAPGDYPCVIEVPNGVNTPEALETFLDGKDTEDILALSSGRTPEQ
ncbi:hypothetical protein SRABI27_03758 [Pedobacter sp. Bi27]|uniref:hypothetical protein n=1 Tax=Pedobacter sp. Bi27 TaxID=2822351 RepID=UPI001DC64E83|nr:hypothetical protein [Pedobacter sp. Bi27]CAH0280417.1 hypothetical protein SRABI27_03758 [Pedobacter sp. Bi27]